MSTKIQAVGFVADKKLVDFIESKTSKLSTYYDKIIESSIHLNLDSHSKVKDKIVKLKCSIPHAVLFSESSAKSFEEATDNALEDMKRQLKRKKEMNIAKGSTMDYELNESDESEWDELSD